MSVTIQNIIDATAEVHGLTPDDLIGPRRHRFIAWPRQQAMYLARKLLPQSLPWIGRKMGNRDHTTILHGWNAVNSRLEWERGNSKSTKETQSELARIEALAVLKAGVVPFKSRRGDDMVFRSVRAG